MRTFALWVKTGRTYTADSTTDLEFRTMSEEHKQRAQRRRLDDGGNTLSPLTAKEAAAILDCNVKSVYEAIKRGEIPSIRLGRMVLIPRPAFERLLRGGETA